MSHIVIALGALVYSHIVTSCSCSIGLFEHSNDVTVGVIISHTFMGMCNVHNAHQII
jgi:hypothetical protein